MGRRLSPEPRVTVHLIMSTTKGRHVRLWLWNVHDGSAHAPDQHHAARGAAMHEVARYGRREEIGAVDVDAPETTDTVDGIVDGGEVFDDAGRSDEVVYLTVRGEDVVDASSNAGLVGDVGEVGRYLRESS